MNTARAAGISRRFFVFANPNPSRKQKTASKDKFCRLTAALFLAYSQENKKNSHPNLWP